MPNPLSLAQRVLQEGGDERRSGEQQWQPMVTGIYYSDSRVNLVTSLRGNAVIATWRTYDENRIYEENANEVNDWFGRKVDGLCGFAWVLTKN